MPNIQNSATIIDQQYTSIYPLQENSGTQRRRNHYKFILHGELIKVTMNVQHSQEANKRIERGWIVCLFIPL